MIEAPAASELVVECLALMEGPCTREAWKAAAEGNRFCFVEALGQSMAYLLFIDKILSDPRFYTNKDVRIR